MNINFYNVNSGVRTLVAILGSFSTNILKKGMDLLISQQLVKQYHCYYSSRMTLSLNNPRILIYHYAKKANKYCP